jgi:predicted PurR-regulated permease PerM
VFDVFLLAMTQSKRISYGIMAVLLVLIGIFSLGPLVLTALFGYFALQQFTFGRSKVLAVTLYLVSVAAIAYGLVSFSRQAYKQLPNIADRTIPAVVGYAERNGIELPFTDYASLQSVTLTEIKQKIANLGHYAREAFFQFALLVAGLVIALSLFLNTRWSGDDDPLAVHDSLYATVVRELTVRFETFFSSFAKVIGAQIVISTINTGLTAMFLMANHFRNTTVLIVLTFLCGLVPIIGNIISNTLIVGVAFTISPNTALFALIFLIVIHKLEYFLNSKIIGDRIKNPMWLTLIGIVLGEKLMGVPGMILAPVVLHYIKVEASRNKLAEPVAAGIEPAAGGKK